MKNKILSPACMLITGLLIGIISKLLDIYTQNLGDVFSQAAVWILLGTLISIYSSSTKKAMLNILVFCIGMLTAYYAVAMITNSVYGKDFIIGWSIFALFTPIFAYFAHMTNQKGILSKIISAGIILVSVLSGIILFGGLGISDFIINAALVYFLFLRK